VIAAVDSGGRRVAAGAEEESALGCCGRRSPGPEPKKPPNGLYCCCGCCCGARCGGCGAREPPNGFQNCAAAGISSATLINAAADALARARTVVRELKRVRGTRLTSKRQASGQYYDKNVNWKMTRWLPLRAGIDRYFCFLRDHDQRLRRRSRIAAVAKPSAVAPTEAWNARSALRVRGPNRPSGSPMS